MIKSYQEIFHKGLYINRYSIVTLESSFYIFGGWKGISSDVIASFSTVTKQWRKLGYLNKARYGQGVIIQQGDFIIVGGWSESLGTERCSVNGDSMQCATVEPKLEGYYYYPEMMLVPGNFCQT